MLITSEARALIHVGIVPAAYFLENICVVITVPSDLTTWEISALIFDPIKLYLILDLCFLTDLHLVWDFLRRVAVTLELILPPKHGFSCEPNSDRRKKGLPSGIRHKRLLYSLKRSANIFLDALDGHRPAVPPEVLTGLKWTQNMWWTRGAWSLTLLFDALVLKIC